MPYVDKTVENGQSSVISLVGDLGAGKSTLARRLAYYLGIGEKLPSPTFLLMKEYVISPAKWGKSRFVHVDAYRVKDSSELVSLGFLEIMEDAQALIVIEWADRIKDIIPKHALWLQMRAVSEKEREVERASI